MRRTTGGWIPGVGAVAALFMCVVLGASASAMEVLEAEDHAELAVEISATEVTRITLIGDRIARVIRSPGGFAAEHDPASGDLYLRPLDRAFGAGPAKPAALFVGTEKGFTYRLTLTPAEGGPAQVLIRNPDALAGHGASAASDPRIGALVALIRAAARREPPAGYVIEAAPRPVPGGFDTLEVWRGPDFTARVLALGPEGPADAAALAALLGPGIAAAWMSARGPDGGRHAVAVHEKAGSAR